jgi:hypothetical protein
MQNVSITRVGNTQDFLDGEKHAVILEYDSILSGYQMVDFTATPIVDKLPISFNDLPFLGVAETRNKVLNTVDKWRVESAQDTVYENRPNAPVNPYDYPSLEFSAVSWTLSQQLRTPWATQTL